MNVMIVAVATNKHFISIEVSMTINWKMPLNHEEMLFYLSLPITSVSVIFMFEMRLLYKENVLFLSLLIIISHFLLSKVHFHGEVSRKWCLETKYRILQSNLFCLEFEEPCRWDFQHKFYWTYWDLWWLYWIQNHKFWSSLHW